MHAEDDNAGRNIEQPPETLAYARALECAGRAGLIVLAMSFAVYALGVLPPSMPVSELPAHWAKPRAQYVRAANTTPGWGWAKQLHRSDFLCILPMAFLATASAFCYARILPMLIRKRDWACAGIALAELLVMLAAASGLSAH